MASFYTMQMIAFGKIDERISTTIKAGSSVNVAELILDITRNFPVSQKAVSRRVDLYVKAHCDEVELVNGEVRSL